MVVRTLSLRFATEAHPFPGSDGDRGRGRDQMVPYYHQPLLPANDREVDRDQLLAPQLFAIEDIKVEEDDEEPLELGSLTPEGWLSVSWQ